MMEVLVALGANLPSGGADPASTLSLAVRKLCALPGIYLTRQSRWFRTPAYPPGAGPDFVNAAALFETSLTPDEMLACLHMVERDLGRTRPERWAPRVCDLDLLAAGSAVAPDIETVRQWIGIDQEIASSTAPEQLILPHPRLHQRSFVLVPLADIAPDWRHPVLDLTTTEMLEALSPADVAGVRPI